MKIYKVKVNGKVYEVELESVEEKEESIQSESKDNQSTTKKSVSGKTIKSPMQGTVQRILVKPGQNIKKGESVLILEAMKMENDITAEKDYKVVDVLVKEGDNVDSDQALIKVE
ncbi:MAG: biotin/lipoyl-containing protein [Candidatus Izemoplasmatales bacterium]